MQHLDEGTIHAWLDGALAPNEASAAEAHVQACDQCARAVAEARGLIAASSRILGALDDVPAIQSNAGTLSLPAAQARRSSWWRRGGIGYAAAATALLAVGTTLVWSRLSPDAALESRAVVNEAPAAQSSVAEAPKDSVAAKEEQAAAPPSVRNAASDAVADAKNIVPAVTSQKLSAKESERSKQPEPKKEELAIDRVVQLPGPMPRPATPANAPPVRQQIDPKTAADFAARAANASQTAQVLGRVVDAATGAPVVGARVSIDAPRVAAQTDSTGKFQLQAVPLGAQTVRVRAIGFEPAEHSVAVVPKDSVQLAFTLQKSTLQLQDVVVTGAAASARQDRRDAQGARREAAQRPQAAQGQEGARLGELRSKLDTAVGCYTLRAQSQDKARDEDRALIAALPTRIQLESELVDRSRANETSLSRARTVSGTARAESWRIIGDSLEVTLVDGDRRHALRFVRRDTRWVSDIAILEPCSAR